MKPKNREDIAAVLEYAEKYQVGVAIRTGGHQYSGASSATAPNIQMDLSETFQGPDDRILLKRHNLLRTSVSWSLKELSAYLRKNKVFVPHGQCIAVHLGGHVQTGGYGQLGRSFGLFGDHVTEIEIVTHEGLSKTISKNNDPDLFYSILGGSPGNFCVLTHFTIKVYRDETYQGSTGMKCVYPYSREKFRDILDIVVKMSDDVDPEGNPSELPRNYDVCVSVLSSGNQFSALFPGRGKLLRDVYNGDGTLPNIDPNVPEYPRVIIVWAQWVKLNHTDTFDRTTWFDKLSLGCIPTVSMNYEKLEPQDMSLMTSQWWVMDSVREYPWPYVKSTRMSDKKNLRNSGWSEWISGRIDEVVKPSNNGLFICAQIQPFGGVQSQTRLNADNGTSYSWRDSTICCTLDCFYKPESEVAAKEWLKKGEEESYGPNGIFSTKDMRPLWGSFGNYDFSQVWNAYHEDEAKYNKLRVQRKKHDPKGVFTPNTFCVPRAE